jgi:hypothetical protein
VTDISRQLDNLSLAKRLLLEQLLRRRLRQASNGTPIGQRLATTGQSAAAREVSFAQQRIWFLDQLAPGNPIYNCPGGVRLIGALDVGALERALTELARRHEILRTAFDCVEGRPVPVVHAVEPAKLPIVDLRQLDPGQRDAQARGLIRREALQPFDLRNGPVMRTTLLRLAPEEHVLLITVHHIASDRGSIEIIQREAGALYEAFAAGRPSPLPPLPAQYSDYARWQRDRLQPAIVQAQVAYWRRHLDGAPERLEVTRHRPALPLPPGGAQIPVAVDASLRDAMRQLGGGEGATLFMALLAGFAALLGCETRQTDVVIGIPVGNRPLAEIEGLIGFFVNTLPVRIDLRHDPTFIDVVSRVREAVVGAYAHQELPFERLVEELQPERRATEAPLCQAVFNFSPAPDPMPRVAGLTIEPIDIPAEGAAYDLALLVEDSGAGVGGSGVRGVLRYRTDRVKASAARHIRDGFIAVLQAAVSDRAVHLSSLQAALDRAERDERRVQAETTRDAAGRSLRGVRRKVATSSLASE